MVRIAPENSISGLPCSIAAVSCALGYVPEKLPSLRNDGWATLNAANKFIRAHLRVKKRVNYKRGERPLLKDLHVGGKAIVCVYGHFLFLDHETYYSSYNNQCDEVVAVWLLNN